jgi:hypothetical protein
MALVREALDDRLPESLDDVLERERARAEGAKRISVIANPRATGFYERVGFEAGEPAEARFGPATWMYRAV